MIVMKNTLQQILYKEGEVPPRVVGRGMWRKFGNEVLFSPFTGGGRLIGLDWECSVCGCKWYKNELKKIYDCKCPVCKTEISFKFDLNNIKEWLDV